MEKGEIIGRGARAVVYALPDGKALKLYGPTSDPESIRQVEHESWLGRAVYETGLAVPRVYGTVSEDGAPGIVYERAAGREMLRELFDHPEQAAAYAAQMAELHAEMHKRTIAGLPRAMAGLKASIPRLTVPADFADLGDIRGAALTAASLLADGDRLCHGDFHPLNIMTSPRGPLIIDWANACLGAPVADVARTVLILKMLPAFVPAAAVPPAVVEPLLDRFTRTYLTRYAELAPLDPVELDAWELPLAVLRIDENLPQEWTRLKALIAGQMAKRW